MREMCRLRDRLAQRMTENEICVCCAGDRVMQFDDVVGVHVVQAFVYVCGVVY